VLTSEEVIAALQEQSATGLKLYLEHLIFEKHDSVVRLGILIVEDVSASGTAVVIRQ
jgi:hypothetical protein